MILIFRKYVTRLLFILSFITILIAAYWFFERGGMGMISMSGDLEQIWWSLYSPVSTQTPVKLLSLGVQLVYALVFLLILGRQMRRNPSGEMAFLSIFLFTFSLQIFRLAFLTDGSFVPDTNTSTRIVYFSRLLGLSALFGASLFATGLQIQKFGQVLLICLLTSFSLASLLPVNGSITTAALLHRIAREKHLALFCLALEILTVLNYIAAAQHMGRSEYYRLSLLSLSIIVGYEMLFFLYPPFILPGLSTLIIGTVLFIGTSRRLFLWS
jgi:hypothetical protein